MIALVFPDAIACCTSGQVRSSMYTERCASPGDDPAIVNSASQKGSGRREAGGGRRDPRSGERSACVDVVSGQRSARILNATSCYQCDPENTVLAAATPPARGAPGQPGCDA